MLKKIPKNKTRIVPFNSSDKLMLYQLIKISVILGKESSLTTTVGPTTGMIFNQVFNENQVIVMLKSAAGFVRACGRQLLVSGQ